ncbi:hypothetical protein ABIF79_005617 [Bradyrhizobium japonicum]
MVSASFMVDTSSHPRAQLHRCVERSAYDHLGSSKLPPDNYRLVLVNTVKLEDRLGSIHTDTNGKIHQTFLSSSYDAGAP